MRGGKLAAGLLGVGAEGVGQVPLRGADPAEELGHLRRIVDQPAIQVPRIPVEQHAPDVKYDGLHARIGHGQNVAPG
jgi:hypothetical protein